MKTMFITTITGPDSPGIIKAIAETTRRFDGEWITSKVMKLEGRFSALMKVSVDESNQKDLKTSLEKEFPDLIFSHAGIRKEADKQTKTVNIEIDCKDRPGLTRKINHILADLDLVVENMECNRVHVSSIGEAVFMAKIALAVTETEDVQAIADEIEALSDEVRVNVI